MHRRLWPSRKMFLTEQVNGWPVGASHRPVSQAFQHQADTLQPTENWICHQPLPCWLAPVLNLSWFGTLKQVMRLTTSLFSKIAAKNPPIWPINGLRTEEISGMLWVIENKLVQSAKKLPTRNPWHGGQPNSNLLCALFLRFGITSCQLVKKPHCKSDYTKHPRHD